MEPVKTSPDLDRKLVAILAADVVGYTRHMERDEVTTLAVLSAHRTIIDNLITTAGGRVTGSAGDSVMAEFSSVLNAVQCAVALQETLWKENSTLDESKALHFRIGVNVGDVIAKDADIFGDGVNVAARLESLSEPGGVCVSRGVRDYVDKQTAYTFDDLGEQKVKNIGEPIRAFSVRFDRGMAVLDATAFDESSGASTHQASSSQSDAPIVEVSFWDTVKDSGRSDELRAYLEKYPEGNFVDLAKIRLAALNTGSG